MQALRHVPGQKVELVFLVDSSTSVGAENFFNELKFVKKLQADFTVSVQAARVAVVTFSSKNLVVRHIDHDGDQQQRHKCRLLEQELPDLSTAGLPQAGPTGQRLLCQTSVQQRVQRGVRNPVQWWLQADRLQHPPVPGERHLVR